MATLRRRLRRRGRGDRGAALVELAIVVPLLGLLVAGIIEFGTGWRDALTVSSSTRASTRVVSNMADNRLADFEALLSLRSALAGIDGFTIEGVLIYDASRLDGQPDASCFDASGNAQASFVGDCNYYSSAQVYSLTAADFIGVVNCAGAPDEHFCPLTDRETSLVAGVTNIGVWVRINRDWFTDMFPGTGMTITDRTVMKVEPVT